MDTRGIVFWAALPFVLPQALKLKLTAPRFAGASGPTFGRVSGQGTLNLLAIGDSIIAGVGASTLERALVGQTAAHLSDRLDAGVEWAAVASIGATSSTVLKRLVPRLPPGPADVIVLSVGVNDLTSLSSVSAWRRSLGSLLASCHRHSPDAILAVVGIPPLHGFPLLPQPMRALFGLRGRAFDEAARSVVNGHAHAVYVPIEFDPAPEKFSPDGYHPNESSYVEFGEVVATAIVAHARRLGRVRPDDSFQPRPPGREGPIERRADTA